MNSRLIAKYNVSAPRYTSYPTVPLWDSPPDSASWANHVKKAFQVTNKSEGISLYIHLPYCESLCTYCGCNTRITVNHKVELPYINALLKEWQMYIQLFGEKPNIREIHLGGGTPTFFSPQNLGILIKGILSVSNTFPDAEFSFEAHPANTSEQHLRVLHNLGFTRLSLGIQDFDERVQEIINRKQSFDQVQQVVEMARFIGYTSINFDLIYGLPLQNRKSIADTIYKVRLLRPDRIAFYSYAHVPWIKPGQRKFTEKDLPQDAEKRVLYEMGWKQFKEAGYSVIGMDHFSLKTDSLYKARIKNQLHRNFMGYTHQKTHLMIGLGVSSISDSWDCFAQNVKTVEEYQEKIESGELPIFKGHQLTPSDLFLRQQILNIMCHYQTSWKEEEWRPFENMKIKKYLQELDEDKLIELGQYSLKVKAKGKAFLRNICMAFDERLMQSLPKEQLFSSAV